jgi:ABC-2 type transport system permease protein
MVSMKRVLADFNVFRHGYVKNRMGLFFALAFPVILILIFGTIFSTNSGTITVYAQNQDGSAVSTQFLNALNSTGTVNVQMVSSSQNFTQYLLDHSAADGIVIPANFSAAYQAGNAVTVTEYGNPASSTGSIVSGAVNGVSNYFNLQRYHGSSTISVSHTTVSVQQASYVDTLIPGLIGFTILVSPMSSLVNLSAEYKKEKLFKQLSLTPLTKIEWLAAKVLWYICLSVLSVLLMYGVGTLVFGAHITLTVWIVPFLILGPTLFASLGMLVGTVTKTSETAGVVGNLITFPMMFLAGSFFPVALMPQFLQAVAHALPLYYIIDGLNATMVYANYTQALIDIAAVAAITGVVFVAATKLFKWRED